MEAVKDFAAALTEVESLLAISKNCDPSSPHKQVLAKTSLLLLTAKLECFFEDIVEEYCALLCTKDSAFHLPHAVKVSASRKLFVGSGLVENESLDEEKTKKLFVEIAAIWGDTRPCPRISIENKFSYGKHGEGQVTRLFRRIGIDDVFSKFPVEDATESLASPEGPKSLVADFNSLSSLRNNIIHTDATPSLTEREIERYQRRFLAFALKLERFLESSLALPAEDHSCVI